MQPQAATVRGMQEPEWDMPPDIRNKLSFTAATVEAGQPYLRITRVHFLDEDEAGGRHHLYAMEPHDPQWRMAVTHGGNTIEVPHDKPVGEPAANYAMYGEGYAVHFSYGGHPSDSISGFGIYGNRHVCFELWVEGATASGDPDPDPDPTPSATIRDEMLQWTADNQLMSLNPNSSLESKAAEHGFYPVSNEGRITVEGVRYAIRGFEKPQTFPVQHRAYYAPVTDYSDVKWFDRE